ncbi:hypothetical protein NDU88_006779 [Pleurodeles waltl]|uniref:Uncharacterized protein n=1 Tax=Pleurodeles waltl TaxID=8319 RepID=A0AAV7TZI0_PLEWA|nr:hypothetical protein NDU88_006779 [Pleurodeles waltl]
MHLQRPRFPQAWPESALGAFRAAGSWVHAAGRCPVGSSVRLVAPSSCSSSFSTATLQLPRCHTSAAVPSKSSLLWSRGMARKFFFCSPDVDRDCWKGAALAGRQWQQKPGHRTLTGPPVDEEARHRVKVTSSGRSAALRYFPRNQRDGSGDAQRAEGAARDAWLAPVPRDARGALPCRMITLGGARTLLALKN